MAVIYPVRAADRVSAASSAAAIEDGCTKAKFKWTLRSWQSRRRNNYWFFSIYVRSSVCPVGRMTFGEVPGRLKDVERHQKYVSRRFTLWKARYPRPATRCRWEMDLASKELPRRTVRRSGRQTPAPKVRRSTISNRKRRQQAEKSRHRSPKRPTKQKQDAPRSYRRSRSHIAQRRPFHVRTKK